MSKYFAFRTTSSRQQFWAVVLIGHLAVIALGALFVVISASGPTGEILGGLGLVILSIAYIWAMLATCVRRCRDAGLNPWWTAAVFLPYIGYIALIVIGVWTPLAKAERETG